MLLAGLLLARVITALCAALLVTAVAFDARLERVTTGIVPPESARPRHAAISLAVPTLAFSEGLLPAERAGVDPEVAAEVMSTSSIGVAASQQ